ncbi:uncharacterized protein LOC122254894 [Penaeus japonicus]|uniref:uncharacterized protein LOC122254894 n=1 Tax=Penaeus japonicus TaxID=27405 RepID=UPI001C71272D|nr:uncharacterized protein LOC122254894 [Penaeus japonicus]
MHQYRFIAHFDPDEAPILPLHDSMSDLVDDLLKRSSAGSDDARSPHPGYALQMNTFYDDLPPTEEAQDLPPFLWVLRHTTRLQQYAPFQTGFTKPIFDMDVARGVFSHAHVTCVTDTCPYALKRVSPTIAYVGHYKKICGELCHKKTLRTETALLRYKETILQAVTSVRKKLQLSSRSALKR